MCVCVCACVCVCVCACVCVLCVCVCVCVWCVLKSRSGDMNVCKKKYKSNMIQTDFVNINDIHVYICVDKPQLNVTFVKICIC